ncbi:ATP-binding protein [Pseudoxanthomonas sp. Root630]|uniref:ATP-binding protein n=1 Tax=Pseudoxanthomonas sp. Root630 TaxID=1736574 RepID=UPI000AC96047|nr:ATP-binding protein [Pseudoxanthomonas sp. Root630]
MSIAARRSHRGDEYQLAVAVHWLIRLLSDSGIVSVQVDAVSLPASPETVDVDDIVITYDNDITRHVQAKKNQPNHSRWKLSDSDLKDELVKAHRQLQKTSNAIIEFCSLTPFGDLAALAECTRDYVDHEAFQAQASSKLRTALTKLERILSCSSDSAFDLVRHIEIGSAHSFDGWEAVNLSALQSQVDDPETAVDVLTKMARGNQSGLRLPPGPLQRDQIVQALNERGIGLIRDAVPLDPAELASSFAAASADLAAWKTTLPNSDWLERPELNVLCERIGNEPASLTLMLGEPGCGKSALLARLVREQVALGIPVLAIKADYLSETVVDTASLGDYLNLPADPIDCVVALAKSTKVLVLVDQLDALADLVVQHSTRLRAPIDLIRGLSGVQNVHIVASCRVFEHRHDTRLRNLDAETMTLDLPAWDNVEATLLKSGIQAGRWNASIREDLRSPQTLNLFLQLIRTTDEADLLLGYQHMLGELWRQQVLSDTSERSREALYAITTRMAEREVLWLPEAMFDTFHSQLQRLARSGILLREGGRVGFRHQTLYEYIRARNFLDAPGHLTDTVLARQHSLRVRPLLWHSLAYMRAVDRPTYAQEIERLWHADLRSHLKMLLIEFLGQLQDPDHNETALVAEKWDDIWYRRRILATSPGSPGWFDWLANDPLVEIMRLPVEEARIALPVLSRALLTRRSRVVDLIKNHWQPFAEKDPLTWFVLEQLSSWDADCIALGRQILARTGISGWQANHMISIVSEADPSQAPSLLDAWLQQRTADVQQPEEEAARIAEVLNGQELHDLPAIAEAAPREFMTVIWPWALKAIQLLALDAHDFVVGYRSVDMRFPDLEEEDRHREKPFISAIIVGVRSLAEQCPEDFIAFLQSNRQVDWMPVQQLLALGLQQVAPLYQIDALEFLLEDPRRLVIGSYRDVHADSNRLIRAVSPHLGEEQIQRLERAIREWNRYIYLPDDDAKTRLHRLQWTRQHRLRLLRAIPRDLLSAACRRHVAEEERAFPGLDDADVRFSGVRVIGSPMDVTSMQRAPDEDILSLFAELTDQTEWDHPRHRMRGGVIQASRELAELAKTTPDKAIRLIRQMAPDSNEIAVGAVLRVLGEGKYEAATLHSLVLELDQIGFSSPGFRSDAADAAAAVVDAGSPLPQDIFDLLATWLQDDPDDTAPNEDDANIKNLSGSVLWSHSGFAIVPRGNYPVLSALTRACLSQEPPLTEQWLSILEAHLRRKEHLKVWEILAYQLRWLVCADHDRAQRFLLNLFQVYPGLNNLKAGVILLAHSQYWISVSAANTLLERLFAMATGFSNQAAGEILMLRFSLKPEEESNLQELLEQHLADQDGLSVNCRIGLAYAAAELWPEMDARTRIHPYLLRLLDLGDEEVAKAAARVFGRRHLRPDAASRELLEHLQARPNLLQQIADNDLGECLVSMLEAAPLVVANVVRSLLDGSGDDFFNDASSRYFLAEHLLTVSLRLQEIGGSHQENGAHIFERLLEFNMSEARNVTLDIDKRTTNAPGAPSPMRRRRRAASRRQ